VDGGRIGDDQLCLPQLLIFDLSTDKLVKRVTIPFDIAHNKTGIGLIASIAVFAPICQNVKNNANVSIFFLIKKKLFNTRDQEIKKSRGRERERERERELNKYI